MKRLRLPRWSGTVLSPRTRPWVSDQLASLSRYQSTATAALQDSSDSEQASTSSFTPQPLDIRQFPSPPHQRAAKSAKLAALHARLSLPSRLPLESLGRCLVDPTADANPSFNNSSLSLLGRDLITYYASEMIICQYPRLPMSMIFGALRAYISPTSLLQLVRDWGVESAAEPGGEVNPGLLQFKKVIPGNADLERTGELVKYRNGQPVVEEKPWNRGISSLCVAENPFGETDPRTKPGPASKTTMATGTVATTATTLETASANAAHALFAAIYLHAGREAAKSFFIQHIKSRHLDIARLFKFTQPTRDLSRLCARQGFDAPVARILSETGRLSRHPVFVVGVFSGRDKLGEGIGGSLDEARIRAAITALKAWYLYSPLDYAVPSDAEVPGHTPWKPLLVDGGEVVV